MYTSEDISTSDATQTWWYASQSSLSFERIHISESTGVLCIWHLINNLKSLHKIQLGSFNSEHQRRYGVTVQCPCNPIVVHITSEISYLETTAYLKEFRYLFEILTALYRVSTRTTQLSARGRKSGPRSPMSWPAEQYRRTHVSKIH